MSKRSRQEFDQAMNDSRGDSKRPRNNNNTNSIKSSEFECPVCYEEFSHHIYQCVEGHLLCHVCRPKFTLCPTCRISLSSNIRNRVLEQILATKSTNNNTKRNTKPNGYNCILCDQSFVSLNDRNGHYQTCEHRKMRCPFVNCDWIDSFNKFCTHAQVSHHTSNGSKQPMHCVKTDTQNIYKFNHAIKFPKDTLQRESADFVWPKIVQFKDGIKFFILSRFHIGHITVFIRLITLSKLSKNDMDCILTSYLNNGKNNKLGQYFIELRVKNNGNKKKKIENESKNKTDFRGVPLRWPSDLFGVTVPFDNETKTKQILSLHHSIFTKYWVRENAESSPVLRFQFQAILK